MFKNYLTTALRAMARNKLFSFINIAGLSIGLAACVLILLFVRHEMSYDGWIPDAERIVRLHTSSYPPDRPPFLTVRSAGRMRAQIDQLAPDLIEASVRMAQLAPTIIRDGVTYDDTISFVDPTFFDVFDLPVIAGSKEAALADPSSMAITEETAIRYFGRTDVVGETLEACCQDGERLQIRIAAVMANLPENTHLSISMMMPIVEEMFRSSPNLFETWTSVNTFTYFKLREGVEPRTVEERIWAWVDGDSPFLENAEGVIPKGAKVSDFILHSLMPITDIHLKARAFAGNLGDMRPLGDARLVYALSGVAALVLTIASINFMNLSTARAARRSREVAVRKTLGATRGDVASQFLGEAVLINMIAFSISLALVELALPFFNSALDRTIAVPYADVGLFGPLIGVILVVAISSGAYPAFYVSRFRPATVMQSESGGTDQSGNARLRSILVVSQFAIAIGLMIATVITYRQTLFAQSLDTGMQLEGRLAIRNVARSEAADHQQGLKLAIERLPNVKSVVYSSEVPSDDNENNTGVRLTGTGLSGEELTLNLYSVDYGFFEAYDVAPVAGRLIDQDYPADTISTESTATEPASGSVILNEGAVHQLGFENPAQALGKTLRTDLFRVGQVDMTIVGVVPDLYFRSIRFGVRPTMYFRDPSRFRVATAVIERDDMTGAVSEIGKIWRAMIPSVPIELEFVDDLMAQQYADEVAQGRLFAAFSGLAILVACLGLYGLAAYFTERRTREIAIRKVLGATLRDIIQLFTWQFTKPVLIANLIAWPVAWYFMADWLKGFAYRVELTPGPFLLAGLAALVIACMTVSGHALRIARTHPAQALRAE